MHAGSLLEPIRHDHRHTETVVLAHCGAALLEAVREVLERGGPDLIVVDAATDLPARAKMRQPAFILLDETILDVALRDDVTVLEELRTSSYTAPIPLVILLPPGSPEAAQLDGFARGADECFSRPASPELFAARLAGLTRRYASAPNPADVLTADALSVDLKARKAAVDGREVILTRKEFDLLNLLMRRRGTVVYTTHLYHAVWGYGENSPVDAHTVKVHVSSLRGKLGSDLGRRIVNLPGLGYRFDG